MMQSHHFHHNNDKVDILDAHDLVDNDGPHHHHHIKELIIISWLSGLELGYNAISACMFEIDQDYQTRGGSRDGHSDQVLFYSSPHTVGRFYWFSQQPLIFLRSDHHLLNFSLSYLTVAWLSSTELSFHRIRSWVALSWLSLVNIRHRDIRVFVHRLMAKTMKTIYFLKAYDYWPLQNTNTQVHE